LVQAFLKKWWVESDFKAPNLPPNHSTCEELLAKSKLPYLKIRCIRTIAIETFKIINKETPQYLHDLVTLKNNKYNFRNSNTAHIDIPTVKTTRYGLNSFRYYASKTWNELARPHQE
jgi:phage FluMu protein Com